VDLHHGVHGAFSAAEPVDENPDAILEFDVFRLGESDRAHFHVLVETNVKEDEAVIPAGMVRVLQKTMLRSVAHFAKVFTSLLGHENAKKKWPKRGW
jgi:hypothetical protein